MRPKPRAAIPGATRRASTNGAVRLTARCWSQSSSLTSSTVPRIQPTPAFGTSTSTGPRSASTSSTSCSDAARSARSAPAVSTRVPPAASSRASSSARVASRAYAKATDAPEAASPRAIAAPIPPLAPVTSATRPASSLLANLERVDDEDERRVGRDRRRPSLGAVGELRGDGELAPAARLDPHETLVPALDHLALAEREVERRAVVPGRVELLAGVVEDADVLHRQVVALLGGGPLADHDVLHHQLLGRRAALLRHDGLRLRVLQVRRGLGGRRRGGRVGGGDVCGLGGLGAAAARDGHGGACEQD